MYDGTFVQDQNPLNISSTRRNPILADVFARMDLMERRGSGLRKIIEAYKKEENYREELKPEFRSTESSFTTILKNLNYDTQNDTQNVGQNVAQNVGQNDGQSEGKNEGENEGQNEGENEGQNEGKKLKPKDRQNKIVKLMKENSNITTIELSHILLVSVSTIERDLKILTDEKTIEYIGSAKDGYWKVNEY